MLNVYDFRDPAAFVEACYQAAKLNDSELTVRKWAARLGSIAADDLMSILKRKKPMSLAQAHAMAVALSLDVAEQTYFEALAKLMAAKSLEEQRIMELVLAELRQLQGARVYVEDMGVFSHWIHMAAMSMANISGCSRTMLAQNLSFEVPQEILEQAVDRLVGMGLLKEENGVLTRNHEHTTSRNDAHKTAPHKYFEQVSELAKLGAQTSAEAREFQCFSLAIGHDQMPAFKEAFRQFRGKLAALASSHPNPDQVYQCNLQLFPLTGVISRETAEDLR